MNRWIGIGLTFLAIAAFIWFVVLDRTSAVDKALQSNDVVIRCVNPYGIPKELTFQKSQVTKLVIEEDIGGKPFVNYYIVDVYGKTYSINSSELANFACEQLNISK